MKRELDALITQMHAAGISYSDAVRQFKKRYILEVLAHRRLLIENRELADEVRAQRDVILRQKLELERLERESPGITRVRWTEDGGVLLEE